MERKYRITALAWTVLITVLSLKSTTSLPRIQTFSNADKIIHFMFYFVFVFLWAKSFQNVKFSKLVKIIVFAIVYGIIIEVLQELLTETRTADWLDILANSAGALTGWMVFRRINK